MADLRLDVAPELATGDVHMYIYTYVHPYVERTSRLISYDVIVAPYVGVSNIVSRPSACTRSRHLENSHRKNRNLVSSFLMSVTVASVCDLVHATIA